MTTNLSAQAANSPVAGAFFQPAPGVAVAGVEPYRDSQITVQVGSSAAAPAANATVATVTPGTAGLWEVSGTVSVGGTTTAAADSHNMRLRQTATAVLSVIPNSAGGTSGQSGSSTFGPVILNLSATDTVNVIAIANATAASSYAAQIVCRLVG